LGPWNGCVILQERHGHHEVREILAARRVGDVRNILGQLHCIKKPRNRRPFLGFLVGSSAPCPTPQFGWQPQEREPHCESWPFTMSENPAKVLMNEMGNQSRVGSTLPHLRADILRQMRSVIALAQTPFRSNVFVAASKRNRLEAHKRDFLGVFPSRTFTTVPTWVVVHVVD